MITKPPQPLTKEPATAIMGKLMHRSLAALLVGGASFLAIAAATAQTAPPPSKTKVEEITVTAQKRKENVRKVPVSVSVLSGAQLKAAHIQNFSDLTQAIPNLSYSSQAGEGLSTLELRGISSDAGTATVALYLDDVSLTTRNLSTEGTAEPRFLDVSRIEVLRGPQGTLYGASALGGTLKYISNPPNTEKIEGNIFSELSGTYHGSVNWDQQGVVNIPLLDGKAALRVSGETGTDSGYIANINGPTGLVVKDNINSNAFDDVRATFFWHPIDWLTISAAGFFQYDIQRDSDAQYLALPNFQTPKVVAEPGKDRVIVPSFTANADLGFADLISVTSNYERQFVRTLDSTVYDNLALYVCDPLNTALTCTDDNGNPIYPAPKGLFQALNQLPSYTFYSNTVRQWSQEVRLVSKPYSPDGPPLTWLVGLYYSDEHTTATDTETVNGASAIFNKYGINPNNTDTLGLDGPIVNDYVYRGLQSYDTSQYAVFGESTYYAMPTLRFTVGARYLYARDGEGNSQELYYDYGDEGLTTATGHSYAFTPKFAIGWDVDPQNTLYANISKGFRLGSENRRIPFIPALANAGGTPSYDFAQLGITSSPTLFGPDKLWNYEVGDKARFFGGRLLVNVDGFFILWKDIQTRIPLVTSGLDFETNAGSATSYGGEFEVRGRVTDSLTAGVSGSVVHATLEHGILVNNRLITGTYPGEWIPGVPEFNLDFDVKQEFQINDRMTGFFSLTAPWVGRSRGDVVPDAPDYNRPSYVTLNASMGIDYGQWEFTMFGKNLTNNNKIIQRPDIQGSASPLYEVNYLGNQVRNAQGFTLRPLTVGVNATYKF
jgi:iron complex outermembrane receptor protein